jgi:hypothetical protein
MTSPNKIYPGGWAAFREESGATRKEAREDFSWMGEQEIVGAGVSRKFSSKSDRMYYEDCREALARVVGAKEWLKAYVGVEEGSGRLNFQDAKGREIQLHHGHSGSSWCAIMWSYKALLNDWDGWVLATKERQALREYRDIQAPDYVFSRLHNLAGAVLAGHGGDHGPTEGGVRAYATQWGFQGSLQEISEMAGPIYLENEERNERERMERAEEEHRVMMGGLVWKYMHPVRWFDTPGGSRILPQTPHHVTGRAIQEMLQKYPDYRQHLQQVTAAMAEFRATYGTHDTTKKMELFLKKWRLA